MSGRYDPDLEPVTAPEPATLPSEHDRSRRSLLGRIAATLAVAAGAFLKFGVFAAQVLRDLPRGRRLRADLGMAVRDRVRAPDPRARARSLRRGEAGRDSTRSFRSSSRSSGRTSRCGTCRFDPWVNARVSIAGPIAGGIGAAACLAAANAYDSDSPPRARLRGLPPQPHQPRRRSGFLDGGHVLRSWRVLRAGGGAASPAAPGSALAVVASCRWRPPLALVARDGRRARPAGSAVSTGDRARPARLRRRTHGSLAATSR